MSVVLPRQKDTSMFSDQGEDGLRIESNENEKYILQSTLKFYKVTRPTHTIVTS
jgi:hypothetical protein